MVLYNSPLALGLLVSGLAFALCGVFWADLRFWLEMRSIEVALGPRATEGTRALRAGARSSLLALLVVVAFGAVLAVGTYRQAFRSPSFPLGTNVVEWTNVIRRVEAPGAIRLDPPPERLRTRPGR